MLSETIKNALSSVFPVNDDTARQLAGFTRLENFKLNAFLEKDNETVKSEFIVVSGVVRAFIINHKGDEVTVNFFSAGQPVSPTLLRSYNRKCFLNLQVITPEAEILVFDNSTMAEAMQNNRDMQQFGNRVLMQDAFYKAEREVVLLKYSGKEKLNWFRKRFGSLENIVPHYYIASFLGLTPTSLSRLRADQTKN